jgi:hypothetical protein
MKTELRFTDTNAASDSKGRTWGLEGNLFWYLVGGVGAGITLFFLMFLGFKATLDTAHFDYFCRNCSMTKWSP